MILKRFNLLMILLIGLFILIGCSKQEDDGLTEIEGNGLTYSEYFKELDELDHRKNASYYKPVSIENMKTLGPQSTHKFLQPIDLQKLPFKVEKQSAYLITTESNQKLKHQLQLSFFNSGDSFVNISATEVNVNPLKGVQITEGTDPAGNQLIKESLKDHLKMYQQVITTNGALVYQYYDYDEANNRITVLNTKANEIYAYYDDVVYHIGYLVDETNSSENVHEEMRRFARQYILGVES